VVSGSVDIAMSNGILGAIGAYVKGGDATPYRIISAEMTGAHELFWWVKADSPIKSLKEADGKIRIVARARDATELQNQTIRANLANVNSLKTKRESIVKFMQVIQKSIDWAYTNPQAIDIFAKNMKVDRAIAKKAVDEYYPKAAMQLGEIRDLERSLKDALDYKFITSPKTPKDIAGLMDIVYKPSR